MGRYFYMRPYCPGDPKNLCDRCSNHRMVYIKIVEQEEKVATIIIKLGIASTISALIIMYLLYS